MVLTSHTPKNLPKRKSSSDREAPDEVCHLNPISNELSDIFNPPETTLTPTEKARILAASIKKAYNKKKANQKILPRLLWK